MMRVVGADSPQPRALTQSPANTGTSVIGVRYRDGILLACDTMVAYGHGKRNQAVQRFFPLGNNTLLAGSGDHSDLQHICKLLMDIHRKDTVLNDGIEYTARALHSYLTRVLYQRRNKVDPLWGTFVLAGKDSVTDFFLGSADMWGTSLKDEPYIATSISSYMAMPHLRLEARPDMTENEARTLLLKVLSIGAGVDMGQSQQVQFARICDSGVSVEDPIIVTPNWGRKDYSESRLEMPLCSYPY